MQSARRMSWALFPAAIALLLTGAARARADSCLTYQCPVTSHCAPQDVCTCEGRSGNDTTTSNFHVTYIPSSCGTGGVHVEASPGGLNVDVFDFDGNQLFSYGGPSSIVDTGVLPREPRTVRVSDVVYLDDLGHHLVREVIVCLPGNQCCGTSCDDGNPCTTDTCDPVNGCGHAVRTGQSCDDGKPCTSGDTCTAAGVCVGTNTCDDGNPCTANRCTASGCSFPAQTGSCSSDSNPCTNDVCQGGVCSHPALADGTGCPSDGNLCTDDICLGGVCRHQANSTPCDDGNPCTVGDRCQGGACRPGPVCPDDGNGCTVETCTPTGCQRTCGSGTVCGGCTPGRCINQPTGPCACGELALCSDRATLSVTVYSLETWLWVTSDPGNPVAWGQLQAGAAQFRIVKVFGAPGKVAVQSVDTERFWSAVDQSKFIDASATSIGPREQFAVTYLGGGTGETFTLQAFDGSYVGAGFGAIFWGRTDRTDPLNHFKKYCD